MDDLPIRSLRRMSRRAAAAVTLAMVVLGCDGSVYLGSFDSGTGEPGLLGVECRGSECPLEAADAVFLGVATEWRIGSALAIAGDLDGDGYDDIVIGGEPGSGDAEAGMVYVIYGGPTIGGEALIRAADARLYADCWSCRLGVALAGVGDFDGDGLDDVAIGAPGAQLDGVGRPTQGVVYVVRGSRERLDGETNIETLPGRIKLIDGSPVGSAGNAVAAAGDVDGDGFNDLLIGAPAREEPGNDAIGAAYLVYGGTDVPRDASLDDVGVLLRTVDLTGEEPRRAIGDPVGVGDVDGDGFDDVAIETATGPLAAREGRTVILYGGPERRSGTVDLHDVSTYISTPEIGPAGGADLDGDGIDDLLLHRPDWFDSGGGVRSVWGRTERFADGADPEPLGIAFLPATEDGSNFGRLLVPLGDVDGDGIDDFAAGPSNRGAGAVYLMLGRSSRPTRDVSFADSVVAFLVPERVGDETGRSVCNVGGGGDVNGDGHADILISVGTLRGDSSGRGAVFLVLGARP